LGHFGGELFFVYFVVPFLINGLIFTINFLKKSMHKNRVLQMYLLLILCWKTNRKIRNKQGDSFYPLLPLVTFLEENAGFIEKEDIELFRHSIYNEFASHRMDLLYDTLESTVETFICVRSSALFDKVTFFDEEVVYEKLESFFASSNE
jgi:hypothetical protein